MQPHRAATCFLAWLSPSRDSAVASERLVPVCTGSIDASASQHSILWSRRLCRFASCTSTVALDRALHRCGGGGMGCHVGEARDSNGELMMTDLLVGIGGIEVSCNPDVTILTMALGSCVAIVACDPATGATGMAHVALPGNPRALGQVWRGPAIALRLPCRLSWPLGPWPR